MRAEYYDSLPAAGIVDQEEKNARKYRGMNPDFVRAVWAKRRASKPQPPPPQKTIGEILAERSTKRIARMNQERLAKLKTQMDSGGVKAIIAEVALAHGVTVDDIKGKGRSVPLVKIRHAAIIEVAQRRPELSLPQIGKHFNRDHTTVCYVLQKHGIHRTEEAEGKPPILRRAA